MLETDGDTRLMTYGELAEARGISRRSAMRLVFRRHEAQTRSDLQQRITETFSTAVEQLGSEKMEVRVGGIYTLERLAGEALTGTDEDTGSSHLYWTVMETLCAFVRERARWKEPKAASRSDYVPPSDTPIRPQSQEIQPRPEPATDIAAMLSVLERRPEAGRAKEKVQRWRLEAHLEGAVLQEAHLEGAVLVRTHLEGVWLRRAHLEGASLIGAHLKGADLREADLKGAGLVDARLEGADLREADLKGAWLLVAHLEDASLSGAHLERANLRGARGLTQDQINEAIGDADTKLPAGLIRPEGWPQAE